MKRCLAVGLAIGATITACGTKTDKVDQSSDQPREQVANDTPPPKAVMARVPVGSTDPSAVEFVMVDTDQVANDAEAARVYLSGQLVKVGDIARDTADDVSSKSGVERTAGYAYGNPYMMAGSGPYGGNCVTGSCGSSGGQWAFPVYGGGYQYNSMSSSPLSGFLRSLFRGNSYCNTGSSCGWNSGGSGNLMNLLLGGAAVLFNGGYQYGYGYQNQYQYNGYNYYMYPGSVCGQNGYMGNWGSSGCQMPTQYPYGGYCGNNMMWYQGQCYSNIQQPTIPNQCGGGYTYYNNNCISQPIAPNPCWQGTVQYNGQCVPITYNQGSSCQGMTQYNGQCLNTQAGGIVNPVMNPGAYGYNNAGGMYGQCPQGYVMSGYGQCQRVY